MIESEKERIVLAGMSGLMAFPKKDINEFAKALGVRVCEEKFETVCNLLKSGRACFKAKLYVKKQFRIEEK